MLGSTRVYIKNKNSLYFHTSIKYMKLKLPIVYLMKNALFYCYTIYSYLTITSCQKWILFGCVHIER